ncbi:uncharacterized protein LOC135401720 [Ornithodoros turicata]|uniref:uncharacterized protein LOC135401720 n=1 Tax=Ornithodoros turicata TaxID=34597 RepID=UPI00313A0711
MLTLSIATLIAFSCLCLPCCSADLTDVQLSKHLTAGAVELDLLHLLNITDSQKGVSRGKGPIKGIPAWRLFSGLNRVQVALESIPLFTQHLSSAGTLSAVFVACPNRRSVATLFSVHRPGKMSPLLRVALNFRTRRFVLSYSLPEESTDDEDDENVVEGGEGEDGDADEGVEELPVPQAENRLVEQNRETFALNSANVRHVKFRLPPSHSLNWTWVAVTVSPRNMTLYINCDAPLTVPLVPAPSLQFPADALVYFRQEPGLKRKFVGTVQVAKLYSGALLSRPWKCPKKGVHDSISL